MPGEPRGEAMVASIRDRRVKARPSIRNPVSRVSIVRILVTGGSGFIGAGVVKALVDRGDHVIAFDIAGTARLDAILAQHSNCPLLSTARERGPAKLSARSRGRSTLRTDLPLSNIAKQKTIRIRSSF